ncbi:TonB-dependent receptor [Sphingomonas sp. RB1R13]|uniref:TonB-dependent receptor n=1 Tax=Sphingomonas sp. RB1R13 TaxID=3096159 RepID=UPI002FC84FE1
MTNHAWLLSLTAVTAPALSRTTPPPPPNVELAERSTSGQPAAIIVTGSRISQLGIADSANAGVVTGKQLAARTVYRPGELLEVTPGLIVSQHSGEGKANQFYLRGFNLDHGTDLRTTIDGMLVNQRSHSHGQGWSDVNWLIPELAGTLDYRKGPYSAEDGDFAAAGSVSVHYVDTLPKTLVSLGVGENGYRRGLVAGSTTVPGGKLLYALELFHNDGPFTRGDNFRKINGVLRYSRGTDAAGFNLTAMAYNATYNATDQIPKRAVDDGTLNRFSSIDPTDGGKVHRYSLSAAWHQNTESTTTKVNAYIINNRLRIYSNFTYFLDDPVNGDQFAQPDNRTDMTVNASHAWKGSLFGRPSETTVGIQVQRDAIRNGLLNTKARQEISETRRDRIKETSVGIYVENTTRWAEKFRTVVGLREDYYKFNVHSSLDANSGKTHASLVSPKLSLIFGPWAKTEFYLNAGTGFHSNDARGTVIAIDPKSGDPADRVPGLVRAKGAEAGIRTEILSRLQSTLSVYGLDFDSELIFEGDAGTTSAGRPSRRVGFEVSNYYKPTDWLTIDADIAYARARFRDIDPAGRRIPGAVEGVASLAAAVDNLGPYFGALQFRYFGPRPLIEDNSVRSKSTTTLNGRMGYKIQPDLTVELEAFNLLNSKSSAIDYYYQSRLPNEGPDGQNDIHFHPIESRSARVTLNARF